MNLCEPMLPPETNDEAPPASARIERRLASLRQEYAAGEEQLRALDERARELRHTMLRIQGAITVLEEVLSQEQALAG